MRATNVIVLNAREEQERIDVEALSPEQFELVSRALDRAEWRGLLTGIGIGGVSVLAWCLVLLLTSRWWVPVFWRVFKP